MYGEKAKVGLILPSGNTVTETEYNVYSPPGVSFHAARMHLVDHGEQHLEKAEADIDRCATLLSHAEVDVITYACTMGSVVASGGPEHLEAYLTDHTGIPAVATGAAVERAFDALGIDSLAVTMPYSDAVLEVEREHLENSGYRVTAISGLDATTAPEMAAYSVETMMDEARKVDSAEADCVFVGCMNYRTFPGIQSLEDELQKPVITSNQATLWNVFERAGVSTDDERLGTLFKRARLASA